MGADELSFTLDYYIENDGLKVRGRFKNVTGYFVSFLYNEVVVGFPEIADSLIIYINDNDVGNALISWLDRIDDVEEMKIYYMKDDTKVDIEINLLVKGKWISIVGGDRSEEY